jgi:hypothetical protein
LNSQAQVIDYGAEEFIPQDDIVQMEDIAFMTQFFQQNKGKTLAELRKLAQKQDKDTLFDMFFRDFSGDPNQKLSDRQFTKLVEQHENILFEVVGAGIDPSSLSELDESSRQSLQSQQ